MRMKVWPLAAVALCLVRLAIPGEASAKVVVCISGGGGRYLNNAEGYYRQLFPVPPNVIHVGGNLTDCLGSVAEGDTLIVVTHGDQATFVWNGTRYAGFSGGHGATGTGWPGRDPFPLPPNFTAAGLNITVIFTSCYSAVDPNGNPISLTSNVHDGLAPAAPAVIGCQDRSGTYRGQYTLSGGTQAQRDAAQKCLEDAAAAAGNSADQAGVVAMLSTYPPANSPSVPNAQTVANNIISADNCPGAGGQVTISFSYPCMPIDPVTAAMVASCDPANLDVDCGTTVPAASPWSLILAGAVIVLIGARRLLPRNA